MQAFGHSKATSVSGLQQRSRVRQNTYRTNRVSSTPKILRSSTTWQCRSHPRLEGENLQSMLGWLVANGAKGVDPKDNPKMSLFVSNDGERGVLATRDISKGDVLFQVPLKLAIIDEEEGDSLVPWSARLACKILSLKAQGSTCPWVPYLDSLPKSMSNPTSPGFSYADIQAVVYEDALEEIDFSTWVASSSYNTLRDTGVLPPESSFEKFCLLLGVVHSRTFSVASKERRDGLVRLLMPLVDMLNHSGDVDLNMSNATQRNLDVIATDACRWDCIPKIGGDVVLCVSAVRDIAKGEEVTLSYGERSNDDFFIHYGFVPPRNPHDTVSMFKTLKEAASWTLEQLQHGTMQKLPPDIVATLSENITGDIACIDDSLETDASNLEFVDSKRLRDEKSRIKLQSKGRIDERYALLLERIHSHISAFTEENVDVFIRNQVARRSFEILVEMKIKHSVDLLRDLDSLVPLEAGIDECDILSHQFSSMRSTYGHEISSSPWWKMLCDSDRCENTGSHEPIPYDTDILSEQFAGYNIVGSDDIVPDTMLGDSSDDHNRSELPIIYRVYKQLILWDSLLIV